MEQWTDPPQPSYNTVKEVGGCAVVLSHPPWVCSRAEGVRSFWAEVLRMKFWIHLQGLKTNIRGSSFMLGQNDDSPSSSLSERKITKLMAFFIGLDISRLPYFLYFSELQLSDTSSVRNHLWEGARTCVCASVRVCLCVCDVTACRWLSSVRISSDQPLFPPEIKDLNPPRPGSDPGNF